MKSAKSYFHRYDRIVVRNVFHDKGNVESHWCFPWQAIKFIDRRDAKMEFACSEVQFLDSDHRAEEGHPAHSQFIQFIDIILGSTLNCLHAQADSKHKTDVAQRILPLVKRLIVAPQNKNSSYGYFGFQGIDFFPKTDFNKSSADSILAAFNEGRNHFYKKRVLHIEQRHQGALPF